MERVNGTPAALGPKRYVPGWQGLGLGELTRSPAPPSFPFNAPHSTGFYVARNAIYHLFRALGYADGRTVLMPAYHSGNETAAVRAAGGKLKYYSVDRRFGIDLDEIDRLAREGAACLYVIHFLGWMPPMGELRRICNERNLLLVEDCALSLYSEQGGRPCGSFGDYSIFCLYKTLPTPSGGLLIENAARLDLRIELEPCGRLTTLARASELALERIRLRSNVVGGALMSLKRAVGSTLNAAKVERVPVGDMDFDKSRANLGMPAFARRMLPRFDGIKIRQRRRENFRLMRELLLGKAPLMDLDLEEGTCPLFFPILVKDKDVAQRELLRRGIRSMKFWNQGDSAAGPEQFPDTHFLRRHLLELPIHQDLGPEHVEYVAKHVAEIGFRLEV